MRRSLLLLCLAGTLLGSQLSAQFHSPIVDQRADLDRYFQLTPTLVSDAFIPGLESGKPSESTQALTWTTRWSCTQSGSFEAFNENKILVRDPKTNRVYLIRTRTLFGTQSIEGGQLQLFSSVDNGDSWVVDTTIFKDPDIYLGMPNLGLTNPEGSNDPADAMLTVFGFDYNRSVNWTRQSQVAVFKASGPSYSIPMDGPEVGNSNGFTWDFGDMVSIDGDASSSHFVGTLGNTGGGQYGTYGQFGFDYGVEDFTANSIPSAWSVSQFRNPNNVNSTFNGAPRIGADEDGRLYMAVNNIFADDENNRVPAFSTSEDQGATWSAFERMPPTLFEAYRTQHGFEQIGVYRPYDVDAMVVTGVNEISYFFRVFGADATGNLTNLDLVEARYSSGTWTLSRVAELNGVPLFFSRQDSISETQGQTAFAVSFGVNPQGHEIGATIADNGDMVVKWVDENPARRISLGGTFTAYFFDQNTNSWSSSTLDTVIATDIYFSYRRSGESAWRSAVNITNDDFYDRGTHIPTTVANITDVPIVKLRGLLKSELNPNGTFFASMSAIPDIILEANLSPISTNRVQTSSFDAVNPSSVNEVENYTFRFHNVTPNPVAESAEVVFTMDTPGTVEIDVFASNGSHMSSVFNGTLDAGLHGLNVDASGLTSGSYYVALTINGDRITQPMVVVK